MANVLTEPTPTVADLQEQLGDIPYHRIACAHHGAQSLRLLSCYTRQTVASQRDNLDDVLTRMPQCRRCGARRGCARETLAGRPRRRTRPGRAKGPEGALPPRRHPRGRLLLAS